ncbi:glycine cleavage system aminomethyltransferase GcvT [Geitlerinema sp. PCC 9228]|uniref:glycine cleavage system aminomethyltransferase GcvT n=1 Tax=Geitlerinema sp. PCC 9228 TaxID=111611 RepID=UPI0008F9BD38|nr:glycine cleavage system aminomethyltransferase GcvT [Geitlerinema sp. PCC 9228]
MAQSSTQQYARTPLYEAIAGLNAKMTHFGGWEMPVQFSGISQEHAAVRHAAGIFDVSHMGKFAMRGPRVLEKLQTLVPSDLSRLQPGEAQYTVLLNDRGGILDDLIFYYQGTNADGEQRWVAIVNAATKSRDKAWIDAQIQSPPEGDVLEDLTKSRILLAVQGPQTLQYLQPLVEADLSILKSFTHTEATILGKPAFVARTGYTGEDGFEIAIEPEAGKQLWQQLVDAGVTPCGLGARDTLRLEAAMPLYGQEIDESTTPLEAGLRWLVHLDSKGDFNGRDILEKQSNEGLSRRLVGLQMEGRRIARHGYSVVGDGEVVGTVTSGCPSPTLGYPIALAYVPTHLARVGQSLQVDVRGKMAPAKVVKKPFYRGSRV